MSSSLRDLFKQMEKTSMINKDFYSAIGAVEQSRKLWANAIGLNTSVLNGALDLKLSALDRSALRAMAKLSRTTDIHRTMAMKYDFINKVPTLGAIGIFNTATALNEVMAMKYSGFNRIAALSEVWDINKYSALNKVSVSQILGIKYGLDRIAALNRSYFRNISSLDISRLTQAVEDAVQNEDSSELPSSPEISEVVETISFIDRAKKPIIILEEFYKKYPATFQFIMLFLGLFCGVVKSYNSINVTIIKSIAPNLTINHVTNYKPNNTKINGSNNIAIINPYNVNIYHSQKVEVDSTVFDSYRFVNSEELKIKLSNNKKSKVVDTIYARQPVEFIEKKGEWVKIKYKKGNEVNKEGWVLSKYLSRYRKLLKGINYINKTNETYQP